MSEVEGSCPPWCGGTVPAIKREDELRRLRKEQDPLERIAKALEELARRAPYVIPYTIPPVVVPYREGAPSNPPYHPERVTCSSESGRTA